MRKPKLPYGLEFDFYWEQFAEPNDPPTIGLIINDDCFTYNPNRKEATQKELVRLKKYIKTLNNVVKYFESR